MTTSILTRMERQVREGRGQLGHLIEAAIGELSPLFTAVLVAIPVVMAALFFVWTHVATLQYGYEISRASEVHRGLIEENRALRVEVQRMKDPKRLAELATARFGLAPPKPAQIIQRGAR